MRTIALLVALLFAHEAWAADPVAVLRNVQKSRGVVKIKSPGDRDWNDPELFMELREDDLLRVTGTSEAVIDYLNGAAADGSRTAKITASNSPFTVKAPPARADAVTDVVSSIANILAGRKKPAAYSQLSGRAAVPDDVPRILSPRATRLLPGPVAFAWAGPDTPYTLAVQTESGVPVWSRTAPAAGTVRAADDGARLSAGTRYVWTLGSDGRYPDDRAVFEVVSEAEAAAIQARLTALEAALARDDAPETRALMRSAALFQARLFVAARDELEAAIVRAPRDAALHQLLGHVLDAMGLREEAANAFSIASSILAGDS
jgi:hypothetical protein